MPLKQVQAFLQNCLHQWGRPQQIKADNGYPLGSPRSDMPSELALWLIGIGISLRNNTPYCPWENGSVEKNQDTTGRWVHPLKCYNLEQVQKALDKACQIHLNLLPAQRFQNRTRTDVFPNLKPKQHHSNPLSFNLKPIAQFLAKGYWTRKVSTFGQISLYGNRVYVDHQLKHQSVCVGFDDQLFAWTIFDQKNQLIRRIPADFLCERNIIALSISQRTSRAKLNGAQGA